MKEYLLKNEGRNLNRFFIAFVFVFVLMWAFIIPYNNAPDEYMRYEIPHFIYKYGALPHGGDPRIRDPYWGVSYGFFPILSYIFSAGFMKIVSFFSASDFALVMAARIPSVLFTTGTAVFAVKIGKKLFPESGSWLYIALCMLLPEAVFVGAYVNNDAMAIFSTAFIVYMWIRGIETKWDYKYCAGLAVGMSFCILSYYNAYGYLLSSAFIFACSMLLCQEKKWQWSPFLRKGLFILGIVFLLTGWWFIRNYIIYDGDFLGLKTNNYYGDLYAIPQYKPSLNPNPHHTGMGLWGMLFGQQWLHKVFQSFVGVFGYMDVYLPQGIYAVYLVIFTGGALGCLIRLKRLFAIRKNREWVMEGFFHIGMLAAIGITNFLNLYHSYFVDFQPQGRYSLPMLIPFMFYVVYGIKTLAQIMIKDGKKQKAVYGLLVVFVAAVALYSFFGVIFPKYGFVHFA